jgi:transposase-like protein
MATYKRYSKDFKKSAVLDYLGGKRRIDVLMEYDIGKTQLRHWTKQWREHGDFPDGRGKHHKGGRAKLTTINKDEMSTAEYIAYLEMENEILKYQAVLENRKHQ